MGKERGESGESSLFSPFFPLPSLFSSSIPRMRSRSGREPQAITVRRPVPGSSASAASMETAAAAHISGENMAKAVVLKDDKGYLVAVIPATYKLVTGELYDMLGRRLEMAGEDELPGLFGDCDLGAGPPVADGYGIETGCDEGLAKLENVYFEGGDHTSLVRVSGEDFMKLMGDARRGVFSHHV